MSFLTLRVVAEHLAAHGRQPINTLAKIDRLGSEKDAALGGQLEHEDVSKKACTTASSGSCGSWAAIRRRVPSGRCSSISMATGGRGQTGAAGTSTKPRAGRVEPEISCAGVPSGVWFLAPMRKLVRQVGQLLFGLRRGHAVHRSLPVIGCMWL